MTRPQELAEAIVHSLKDSKELPDRASYVDYTPDIGTEAIKLPVIEVSLGERAEVGEANTDLVAYQQDANGNRIGKVYESLYTQIINLSVWTAQGSKFEVSELSEDARTVLYGHVTGGPEEPLVHPELGELDDVWRFDIQDTTNQDDLATSPPLRRWEQTLVVNAGEQYVRTSSNETIAVANEDVTVQ